jgi:hypothetical protein
MPSPIVKKMDSMSKRITELLPSAKGGFLTNKWILYLVLFFAVFDVFHFYQKGDVQSVMIFFIVGILISFFSKNMVVILILAVVITHLIRYGKNLTEGFKDEDEEFADKDETEEFADKDETEEFEDEKDEGFEDEKEEFADETEETEKPSESFRGTIKDTDRSVKDALSNLDSNSLTTKTKELLTTQQQLMKNMESLEPLLKKADTFLSKNKEPFTSLAEAYPK